MFGGEPSMRRQACCDWILGKTLQDEQGEKVFLLVLGVPSYVVTFEWTGRSLLDMAMRIGSVYPE
jgi:hypothetical protein